MKFLLVFSLTNFASLFLSSGSLLSDNVSRVLVKTGTRFLQLFNIEKLRDTYSAGTIAHSVTYSVMPENSVAILR